MSIEPTQEEFTNDMYVVRSHRRHSGVDDKEVDEHKIITLDGRNVGLGITGRRIISNRLFSSIFGNGPIANETTYKNLVNRYNNEYARDLPHLEWKYLDKEIGSFRYVNGRSGHVYRTIKGQVVYAVANHLK